VVRRALHGAARSRAHVRRNRRPEISRLHGTRVGRHDFPPLRSGGHFYFRDSPVLYAKAGERPQALLVARQWLGDGRAGEDPRGLAGGRSRTPEVCAEAARHGRCSRGHPESRRTVAIGLLDPASYDLPEVSGSAFFAYAIATEIDQHILDRKQYLPVVQHAGREC